MPRNLLVLIKGDAIFERIIATVQPEYIPNISEHFTSLHAVQLWLSSHNNVAIAALIDPKWPEAAQAHSLLRRFQVPVMLWDGRFESADLWFREYLPKCVDVVPVSQKTRDLEITPEIHSYSPVANALDNVDEHGLTQEDKSNQMGKSTANGSVPPSPGIDNPLLKSSQKQTRNNPLLKARTQKVPADGEPPLIPTPSIAEAAPPIVQETIVERVVEVPVEVHVEKPVYKEIITTLQPRVVAVVNLWPRAGASFLSMNLAYMLAKQLPKDSVMLLEHPNQEPRLWYYFCAEHSEEEYTHWLDDGRGDNTAVQDVGLVPMKPSLKEVEASQEELVAYVYRNLRKPFIVVDSGTNPADDMFLETTDDILVVIDCDFTLLVNEDLARTYREFVEKHGTKVRTILNKWTKYVDLKDPQSGVDVFPGAIKIPYLSPDHVQKALWQGKFPASDPALAAGLSVLQTKLIRKWVPQSVEQNGVRRKRFNVPWGRKSQ